MHTQADVAWLERVLVRGTSVRVAEPDLTELTRALSRVDLPPGSVLYASGKLATGVWIIRQGSVELSEGNGTKRCVVGILRSGDIAGDLYVLLNSCPPITARCIERTEALFLSADDLRKLLAAYPSLAIAWLCNLAARLSDARQRVLSVLGRNLSERLAGLLLDESDDGLLRAPQATIAQMLGVQRTSVNKVLKDWERRGIIHLGYAAVHVDDPDALQSIVDDYPVDSDDAYPTNGVVPFPPAWSEDVARRSADQRLSS